MDVGMCKLHYLAQCVEYISRRVEALKVYVCNGPRRNEPLSNLQGVHITGKMAKNESMQEKKQEIY